MPIFDKDIALDMGTTRVLLYTRGKGVQVREPALVAVDKFSGKLMKVGDLYFVTSAGSRKTVFFDIEQPYEAYKIAQKTVADIQADIAFPNALRPPENEGYGTNYKGGGK